MSFLLTGIVIFYIVLLLILSIYIFTIVYKEQEEPTDDTIFINFLSQYTEGYSFGSIIEVIQGTKRIGIKFIPRDLNYVKLFKMNKNKEKIIIKPQLMWIEKNKLISLPKGFLSGARHVVFGLPVNPEDFNDSFKSTEIGRVFMEMINKIDSNEEETHILRKRINSQTKFLEKTIGNEIVDNFMNESFEITKDISKIANEVKSKSSFSNIPSTVAHNS